MTLDELKARRQEILDDLLRAGEAITRTDWYRDRLREAASLTRQIELRESLLVGAK